MRLAYRSMKITNFADIGGHFVQDKIKAKSTIDLTAFLHKHHVKMAESYSFLANLSHTL